ncbi:hypothetical protein GCM10022254_77540 [Actinomadura meridiana]|uniref:Uncharacterized protein n=1 Tax=Actinomadura meridiana TaxID=559626 RepID=A0ABP8CSG6_9ACTN
MLGDAGTIGEALAFAPEGAAVTRASPGLLCLWAAAGTSLLGTALAVMWVPTMWHAANAVARDNDVPDVSGPIMFALLGFLMLGLAYLVIAALVISAALTAARRPSTATAFGCLASALTLVPCAGGAWIGAVFISGGGLGPYISNWFSGSSIVVTALVPVLSVTGIALLPEPSAANRDLRRS